MLIIIIPPCCPSGAALGIGWQYNKNSMLMWAKIAASFAAVFLLWDVKPVFDLVWSPFSFFMGYVDPRRPGPEPMHGRDTPRPEVTRGVCKCIGPGYCGLWAWYILGFCWPHLWGTHGSMVR